MVVAVAVAVVGSYVVAADEIAEVVDMCLLLSLDTAGGSRIVAFLLVRQSG